MSDTDKLEARLNELELRYSEQQETLEHLSDVLYELQRRSDLLVKELTQLKQRPGMAADAPRSLEDDKPPHY